MDDDYRGHDGVPLEERVASVMAGVRDFSRDLPITVEMMPYLNRCTDQVQGVVLTDLFADAPGNGVGGAVVREMLRLADAADVSVYTDADGPRSAEFYRRMGFEPARRHGHQFAHHPPLPDHIREEDETPGPTM